MAFKMLNEKQLSKKAYDNRKKKTSEDIFLANYDQEPIDSKQSQNAASITLSSLALPKVCLKYAYPSVQKRVNQCKQQQK